MTSTNIFLSKGGFQAVREEYMNLKRRADVLQIKLRCALWHAERFTEEYLSLVEELNLLNKYIPLYASILANALPIISPPRKERKRVYVGARVKVRIDGEPHQLEIMGDMEADPAKGKISNECQLAKTLLGRKEGEHFLLSTPIKVEYDIQKVSYANQ